MSKSIEGEEYLAVKKAAQLPRRVVPDTTNSTLVTVRQLAQDWQVSLDWIYDRLKPNPPAYLTHVRVGRKILFDRDDLQAYLQLHRRSGTVPVSQVPTREVSMNRVRDQRGTMETAGRKTLCYSLRYRDEQGKSYRHKLGNVNEITRAEAEKLRRKFMLEANSRNSLAWITGAVATPEQTVRFRDYVEGVYLPMLEVSNRRSYFRDMRSVMRVHMLPHFANRRLDSLSTAELQTYLNRLAQDGRTRRTALKLRSYLSSMYTAAIKDREHTGIEKNPALLVKINGGQLKNPIELPDCVKFDELVEKLTDPRHKMLLWFAVISGVRMSELRGLQWGNINWETGVVTVRQSAWEGKIQNTKSGKPRLVELSAEQIESLRAYRALLPASGPKDWVFPGEVWGGVVRAISTKWVMANKIKPLMKELGLKFGRHLLRHLNNNVQFVQGVDAKVRQERLGHADATITNAVYTHVPSSMQQDAARKIDAFWHDIKAQREKEKEAGQKESAQLPFPALNVVQMW